MAEPRRSSAHRLHRWIEPGNRLGLIAAIAAGVALVDQVTKFVATHYIAGGGGSEIFGGLLRLHFYRNFAGPNNSLQGHTELISIFAILAIGVIVLASFRVSETLTAVAVGLLLGGAIGNLADRLLREPSPLHGGVIDWLRIGSLTKSMNVADLAIDAGIGLMAIVAILAWARNDDPTPDSSSQVNRPANEVK